MSYLDALKRLVATTEAKQALLLEKKAMGEQIELVTVEKLKDGNFSQRCKSALLLASKPIA